MEERIKKVMAAVFGVETSEINDNTSPDTILNWDSLHHMNLIIALEEEFGITFNDDDIASMLNYKLIKYTIVQMTA